MSRYVLTVVTIVLNDYIHIENTILSVINLFHFDKVEYIVIDGGSNDGTKEIIQKYSNKLAYWVSEKDGGIYDAMNKAIKHCNGKWINFMNSGDKFYDKDIINAFNLVDNDDYNILYGSKIINNKIFKPLKLHTLEKGEIMACHQSMFFNKNRLKNNLYYNLKYEIYSDYELVNRIYMIEKNRFKYYSVVVTDFLGGGISSKKSWKKRREKYLILLNTYGLLSVIKIIIKKVVNFVN